MSMEEWKEYKLGEVCVKIGSGATPKGGKEAYLGGDISLIRSQNVLDFAFSNDGLAYINEEQADKLKNVEVKENDVLLNITGDSVARACIVPQFVLPARVNQHVAIIRGDESLVLNKFILYLLQYKKGHLLSISQGGATRNALTKKMIENFEISLPSLPTQQKIANILSSLDDKIEVNRRINEQLEELAGALFKSWFVDFEPFKDGEFVDSELGMIPKGWKVGTLSEILYISKDSVNPSKMPNCIFHHYSIPAYDNGKREETQEGNTILSNKFKIDNKTTLFSKLNPRIKRVWFVDDVEDNSICSTEFIPYKAKDKDLVYFVNSVLSSDYFYNKIMSIVNGATGSHQRFHPKDTLNFIFAYDMEVAKEYNNIVKPIITKILNNQQEIHHLTTLRDTLLPKLMSGEIDVNEVKI